MAAYYFNKALISIQKVAFLGLDKFNPSEALKCQFWNVDDWGKVENRRTF